MTKRQHAQYMLTLFGNLLPQLRNVVTSLSAALMSIRSIDNDQQGYALRRLEEMHNFPTDLEPYLTQWQDDISKLP